MTASGLFSANRIYSLIILTILLFFLFSLRSSIPNDIHPNLTASNSSSPTAIAHPQKLELEEDGQHFPSPSSTAHPQKPKPEGEQKHAPWLLYTSSSSHDFQRRFLIRWSWVNTFANSSIYDHIFAVSTTDPLLISLIKKENETYGDILLLDHLEDTHFIANGIKPFEVLKKLTAGGWKGRTYDFVSKLDQDSWVDPVRVWEKYLKRRRMVTGRRLMLSMPHEDFCGCPSPQGGFYTLGWPLAKTIVRLFDNVDIPKEEIDQEDCQVGRWPTDAGEDFDFVPMDEEESFDIEGEEGEYVARDWVGETKIRGPVGALKKAVFLHQLKEDEKWLTIQTMFDQTGWLGNRTSADTKSGCRIKNGKCTTLEDSRATGP
ncbi:hypothetical protein ACLMJK_006349 [Lecanora helva]